MWWQPSRHHQKPHLLGISFELDEDIFTSLPSSRPETLFWAGKEPGTLLSVPPIVCVNRRRSPFQLSEIQQPFANRPHVAQLARQQSAHASAKGACSYDKLKFWNVLYFFTRITNPLVICHSWFCPLLWALLSSSTSYVPGPSWMRERGNLRWMDGRESIHQRIVCRLTTH